MRIYCATLRRERNRRRLVRTGSGKGEETLAVGFEWQGLHRAPDAAALGAPPMEPGIVDDHQPYTVRTAGFTRRRGDLRTLILGMGHRLQVLQRNGPFGFCGKKERC